MTQLYLFVIIECISNAQIGKEKPKIVNTRIFSTLHIFLVYLQDIFILIKTYKIYWGNII